MKTRASGPQLGALRYPDFRLFWTSQLAANVGAWMQVVATGWLVLELTDSAASLGLNAAFQAAPLLVFSLVGGVIADRVDRYRLMVGAQGALVVPDVLLAVLVGTGHVRVEHVYAYSFVSATIHGLSSPARQAFVPKLVPPEALLSAVALSSILWHGSAVLGPTLAGLVVAVWGIPGNFYLNVAGQLAFLVALLLIRVSTPPPLPTKASPWEGLAEGARYAWQERNVRTVLLLVAVASMVGRSYPLILPVFARDVFQTGPQGLGLMLTAPALGTILAGFGLGAVGNIPLARAFLMASAALGAAIVAFAAAPLFGLALVALVILGAAGQAATALANTMLQQLVEDRLRGRVMSFFTACTWGANRVGALPIGVLAQGVGAPLAVGLGGVALLLVLAAGARGGALRDAAKARPA